MSVSVPLNTDLVSRAICFHGLPLQKMWEGERGNTDLLRLGLQHPDYSMYQARQKYLTFQDRAKRLKLHQFISKKADELYDRRLVDPYPKKLQLNGHDETKLARMAPYEVFLNVDVSERQKHFFETVKPGDIIYGMVVNQNANGLIVKPICATGSVQRFVGDIGIKALIQRYNLVSAPNKVGADKYSNNDYVCCEVLEVVPDAFKLILGMKGEFPRTDDGPPFGLITTENFPDVYKTAAQIKGRTYNEVLENSPAFNNPRTEELLYAELGLDLNQYYTNMSSLRGRFPSSEYASELRQSQASKWAFRSVAEGIEHFKEGRHSEAFQCLNKALTMDPRNVEGLVARGALYANSGSFKKAVDDFENALKLNSSHANARKYLGETLVALGRSYEEENKIEDARKAYQDCLKIIPNHEEAYNSLEFLKTRFSGKQIVEPNELELPPLNLNNAKDKDKDDRREKKSKKDRKKKSKKRRSSSSESSSSSDSSDSSSSNSSSSGSSSGSDTRHNKRKKSRTATSPFSQRMTEFSGGLSDPFQQFGGTSSMSDDYESKVRQFIEMTRDDDDYEDKVRKFVAEAAKYQRERKNSDAPKKKKRKEEKKSKKDSKKKRKKEKHSKKKDKLDLEELESKKIREALKIFEKLPVLDDLGAKLSEIYAKNQNEAAAAAAAQKAGGSSSSTAANKKPSSIYDNVPPPAPEPSKWKMMFPKDADQPLPPVRTINVTQLGPPPERGSRFGQPPSAPQVSKQPAPEESRVPILPPQARAARKMPSPLYGRGGLNRSPARPPPPVKSGPVVLDKFGNFRLASIPEPMKPPEPSGIPHSRSRSRGRYRRSRSSSRSRSRSRRRSHGRRSRSRSFGRMRRGRFGNASRSRSPTRSESISPIRPGYRGRGRRPGNMMRGRMDRGPRSRPFGRFGNHRPSRSLSPPPHGRPMSPDRHQRQSRRSPMDRRQPRRDESSKDKSRNDDRSKRPADNKKPDAKKDETKKDDKRSDAKKDEKKDTKPRDKDVKKDDKKPSSDRSKRNDDSKKPSEKKDSSNKNGKDKEVKPAPKENKKEPPPPGTDDDLASTEKLLESARKERKEDMISRNPDLVKKPSDAF